MPQVDFYLLPDETSAARWSFACKLIEKVLRLNFQVHVIFDTPEQCQAFSLQLWNFKPESFLPHLCLAPDQLRPLLCPITLGVHEQLPDWPQLTKPVEKQFLLLNLSNQPVNASLSELLAYADRIGEIVVQETVCLTATRNRYKAYQQEGIPIETRKIETAQ